VLRSVSDRAHAWSTAWYAPSSDGAAGRGGAVRCRHAACRGRCGPRSPAAAHRQPSLLGDHSTCCRTAASPDPDGSGAHDPWVWRGGPPPRGPGNHDPIVTLYCPFGKLDLVKPGSSQRRGVDAAAHHLISIEHHREMISSPVGTLQERRGWVLPRALRRDEARGIGPHDLVDIRDQ